MRVATIDIGTNSVLLLVAELRGRDLVPIVERSTITRLGQDVDRTRRLHPDAVARTLECLGQYAALMQQHQVDVVGCVATSASRDATGAESFVQQASTLIGATPTVISGDREARLTFLGALAGLSLDGPIAVQDVGGGSTEIVLGEVGPQGPSVHQAVSLDVGAVRMTERFLASDPPLPEQLERLRQQVRTELARAPSVPPNTAWVGIAGTITTLVAVDLGLRSYDASRVHGARMSTERIGELAGELSRMPLAERRNVPGLEPKRADVIVAGASIVHEVLRASQAPGLVVSDRGVRWGLAMELVGTGRGGGAGSGNP